MKKIALTFLAMVLYTVSFAQKTLPEIKVGTTFNCSAFVQGQEFPLTLSVKSMAGPVSIGWVVDGYGEGTFEMTSNALENAKTMLLVTQPETGATKLSDDETFGIISKSAFKSLTEKQEFTYSGINFKLKSPATAFKIGANEVDASHVVSADGKFEFWILNNPNFPFVLQSAGMPTDITVAEIK